MCVEGSSVCVDGDEVSTCVKENGRNVDSIDDVSEDSFLLPDSNMINVVPSSPFQMPFKKN